MTKEEILDRWVELKKKEEEARNERISLEAEIELFYPFADKASRTFKEDKFKVNIKKNSSYKFLIENWLDTRQKIAQEFRPEIMKFEVDVKGLNYLQEKQPEIYKVVSNCIEFKNNKSTIKVERI